MPLYAYRCPAGDELEVFHKMDEQPEVRCPSCGQPAERIITPPMIHTQYHFSTQIKSQRRSKWKPPADRDKG
jgi:putative FmdB family regulatory protein